MGSFEWMELDTLTRQIEHSQSRLDAAKATKNLGLVQLLQKEIAGATERRARVLSDITKVLGNATSRKRHLQAATQAQLSTTVNAELPLEEHQMDASVVENASREDEAVVCPQVPARETIESGGVLAMWDKLTRADVERVKQGLAGRRSELLARHAEELKTLDGEQTEIDIFERAIGAFASKFKIGESGEVVPFDPERSVQVQAG